MFEKMFQKCFADFFFLVSVTFLFLIMGVKYLKYKKTD